MGIDTPTGCASDTHVNAVKLSLTKAYVIIDVYMEVVSFINVLYVVLYCRSYRTVVMSLDLLLDSYLFLLTRTSYKLTTVSANECRQHFKARFLTDFDVFYF